MLSRNEFDSALYIGVDLGGTKIRAGTVNGYGEILSVEEERTPVEEGREGILREMIALIAGQMDYCEELNSRITMSQVKGIGIASAGRINTRQGSVIFATDSLPGWTGTPIKQRMESEFGLPVCVDNDVNAAAAGEMWLGAARSQQHFLYVALGTGVGGALVYDGKVINGPTGSGGNIGHLILHPGGLTCSCGQQGCLELYVSGTALNSNLQASGQSWNSYEWLNEYSTGNPAAIPLMQQFVKDISLGLVSLVNIYDPELILLGGGLSKSYTIWKGALCEAIKLTTPNTINLIPSILGNDAGWLGAAFQAKQLHNNSE